MHRRQFLQGLSAAFAAVLTWGKGKAAEVEADQPAPVGRKSIHVNFVYDEEVFRHVWPGENQASVPIQDGSPFVKLQPPMPEWMLRCLDDLAPEPLTTRTAYQVSAHASFMRDEGRVIARYDVAGTDRVLIVMSWISHEIEEDEAAVGFILGMMDDEAEYIAAHPDEAPSSHWEWT